MDEMVRISGYHAHVYFDAATLEQARALCEDAAKRFPVKMGRVHERLIGPHPCWSCQLAFRADLFAGLVPWLMLNRGGLDVLLHPITGNELRDHRDCAMWIGRSHVLDLSVLDDAED
ncbi:DOPA 4,5-dioxygenase family protein [Bowmanella yangjiangensis]|nr:DOPA 4,5-dioxygenase family protein [Bowmanella yangjiangensis]